MDDTSKVDIAVLQTEMREVKSDISEIKGDIRKLLEFTQQARGSWRTLMAVGGASAAIGGLVSKLLSFKFG